MPPPESRHDGAPGRGRAVLLALVLVVLVGGRADLRGQDIPSVRLVGEVRDIANEQPIPDIAVKLVELEMMALTDRNGFFDFDSIPPGLWTFEASGLGYKPNTEASTIGRRSLLLIRLEAAPYQLEGLYVTAMSGLVRRRTFNASRVFAWDREELEKAVSPDVGLFVARQGVAQFVRCGGEYENDLPNCFMRRGRPRGVAVVVDDEKLPGAVGTGTLWAYDPRDLWSVEFAPSCGQIRVYTMQFMQWVEEGRTRLRPLLCGG